MSKQININSLEVGTIIKVRGKVAFSRVRSQIAGEELKKVNDRNRQYGRPVVESAHTKLDMKLCTVLCQDPNNLTLAERFIQERLYQSQKHPENGFCYQAMNKGKFLPQICEPVPGTNPPEMRQFEPEEIKGELANDLDVTVFLRVFKGNPNNGLSLDFICVNEPIRFYTPGNADALAKAGIIMRPSSAGKELAAPPAAGTSVRTQPEETQATGYGAPQGPASQADAYTARPEQAAAATNLPYGTGVAAAPTAQAAAPVQQTATAAAAPVAGGFTGMPQPAGIRFEENATKEGSALARNYG